MYGKDCGWERLSVEKTIKGKDQCWKRPEGGDKKPTVEKDRQWKKLTVEKD